MVDVPTITVVEPVYRKPTSEHSEWVECDLVWDEEVDAFVNFESEDDWVLDDRKFPDSTYEVEDTVFTSLEEAVGEALKGHPVHSSIKDIRIVHTE